MEEKLKLENLIKVAKDEKLSMDERYKAVDALNKIVPQYNATIDKTTKKFRASDKALKAYINNLVKLYEVQGAKKQIQSLAEQRAELEVKLAGAKKNLSGAKSAQGVSYTTSWGAVGNTQSDAVGHFQSQVNSISNSIKRLDAQINAITGAFGEGIRQQTVKESSEPDRTAASEVVAAEKVAAAIPEPQTPPHSLIPMISHRRSFLKTDRQISMQPIRITSRT